MALTYDPKIEKVRNGECTQIIRTRRKRTISVGDLIIFHGWEGRPHHTKWSWRKKVIVTSVEDIMVHRYGILFLKNLNKVHWDHLGPLAARDGINPPSGYELQRSLFVDPNNPSKEPIEMQIIRWDKE